MIFKYWPLYFLNPRLRGFFIQALNSTGQEKLHFQKLPGIRLYNLEISKQSFNNYMSGSIVNTSKPIILFNFNFFVLYFKNLKF